MSGQGNSWAALLAPADDPEVQRLTTIVSRLPESRQTGLISTLLRAVVTYEATKDPHVLESFASAVRVTLRLHAADPGYAAALERNERAHHQAVQR